MKTSVCVCLLAFFCRGFAAFGHNATTPTVIDAPEFQARRKAALEKVPDGIILPRSAWGMKHWDESEFHQDPSFYYFTGLANAHAAILALDGTKKESWLFVPPRMPFGADLHGVDAVFFDPGATSEQELGIAMAEGAPKTFQAGNVLRFEPLLTAGNQAFFVEDTFLITATGHEVVNPALPYAPRDIERAMKQHARQ
jgi:Xaa-Pro aminopeptidase